MNSAFEKIFLIISLSSLAACGKLNFSAQEHADVKREHEASSSGELANGSSSISAQEQAARENDQVLENALKEPDQQTRADLASQVRLRSSYRDCVKKSGGATPALLDCNAEEYRYQDFRLNKLYRERMANLDKSQQSDLRERQREWIKSRDQLCNLNGSLGGGQAEELEQSSCHLNATAKRCDELERGVF